MVNSLALISYSNLLLIYKSATAGLKGSSGFGSVNKEQIDNNTFVIVKAGDHWSFKMSKQISPFLLIFGW